MRQTYERLIFSDFANSVSDACSPLSSMAFHRCARARALTIVPSTTVRTAVHGAPSGLTTSLRVPRRATGKGTRITSVPLSEESYASIYFSNHEGRPMNAREWWHLKQVVELASHAFSAPEDKTQAAPQAMVAGA